MESLFLHMLHITIRSILFLCSSLSWCSRVSFLHQRRNTVWCYIFIFGVFVIIHERGAYFYHLDNEIKEGV
jgi:hypothetical protein